MTYLISGISFEASELTLFEKAMAEKMIFLPDGRIVSIQAGDVAPSFDDDVWCDDFDLIVSAEHEQGFAMFMETVANAGLCPTSGSSRFNFVLQNLDLKRATGDLFDWDRILIDRRACSRDWRKEKMICDAFSKHPRRDMNRLKEKIEKPRDGDLIQSKDDYLLWRMCYFSIARKVFLARAGYTEYCEQRAL